MYKHKFLKVYMISLYIALHILAVIVWLGGMFFAYACLRPVAAIELEPPLRLKLWVGVFARFFPVVWVAVLILPLTGYLMLFSIWQGFSTAPLSVHIMNGIGILMILIFMHVYFSPYKKLKNAVATEQWPVGADALAQIRQWVGVNIVLGVIVTVVASAGRYLG